MQSEFQPYTQSMDPLMHIDAMMLGATIMELEMKKYILCLVATLVAIFTGCSTLTKPVSPIDSIVLMGKMATEFEGKSICTGGAKTGGLGQVFSEYSKALSEYTQAHPDKGGMLSDKDIYLSLVSHFPCPFDPKLAPVGHAVSADLVGHWELVPASLKIKTNAFQQDPFPSNCEYFSFFQDGEMHSLQIMIKGACPSLVAADFRQAKAPPKVIDWKLGSDGMLKITRTDIPSHVELWEAFIAISSFSQYGVTFEPGDLLLFMAQFNQRKKEDRGTLYFRQFRKMAGS